MQVKLSGEVLEFGLGRNPDFVDGKILCGSEVVSFFGVAKDLLVGRVAPEDRAHVVCTAEVRIRDARTFANGGTAPASLSVKLLDYAVVDPETGEVAGLRSA